MTKQITISISGRDGGDYSVTIAGTGAIRARVGSRSYIKVGCHIYGKMSRTDRITPEHALLQFQQGLGTAFIAREDETCAQALARLFTLGAYRDSTAWDLDHGYND